MENFRTILRYFIDPQSSTDYYIRELVQFCQAAHVDEVMLLLTAEELSTGHMTRNELEMYCELGSKLRPALEAEGIDLSLNPWTTLYQVPRGRKLQDGQDFRLMVGETGSQSPLVACPLCTQWQAWLAESFARLAGELRPVAIWLEDDWRLHNHGPTLGWGGCFCDEHMRLFSEMVGQEVGRETLIDTILQPGDPHPWREVWFELSRRSLLEPMQVVTKAIQGANPATRVALMSSRPDQHSIEGRSWSGIHKILGGKGSLLLRPHMEPYTEGRALRTTMSVTRHTLACVKESVEAYPELENSPRCGIYSKSGRYSVWQMLESALIGSRGITINHFDNMGNGIGLDRKFQDHLAASKPLLNAIVKLGIDDAQADGVQVLFSPQVASHLHLPPLPPGAAKSKVDPAALSLQMQQNPSGGGASGYTGSMQSLVHPSITWAETCAILGIAHRLTDQIEPQRGPILVNGQTLRAFSKADIERLLSGFVVLDAEAVEVLRELGYGESIGIGQTGWKSLEGSAYSYEELSCEDPEHEAAMKPRVCAQRLSGRLLAMEVAGEAEALSYIHGPDHAPLWPGSVLAETPQGGQAVSLCYPLDGGSQFFMAYFSNYRRQYLQNLFLKNAAGARLLMGPDGTRCYRVETREGTLFAVLNPTLDRIDNIAVRVEAGAALKGSWTRLGKDGAWVEINPAVTAEGIDFGTHLDCLEGFIALLKPKS